MGHPHASSSSRMSAVWLFAGVLCLLVAAGLLLVPVLLEETLPSSPQSSNQQQPTRNTQNAAQRESAPDADNEAATADDAPEAHDNGNGNENNDAATVSSGETLAEAEVPSDDDAAAVLREHGAFVQGRVVDSQGEPVPNATIHLDITWQCDDWERWERDDTDLTVEQHERETTDESGRFEYVFDTRHLRRGPTEHAESDVWVAELVRLAVALGPEHINHERRMRFEFAQGEIYDAGDIVVYPGILHGRVVDYQGAEVPGAVVRARYFAEETRGIHYHYVTSDAAGRFRIHELRDVQYELHATHEHYRQSETVAVDPEPAQSLSYGPVTLELGPAYQLEVIVRSLRGEALPGARVTCAVSGGGRSSLRLPADDIEFVERTDEHGRILFSGLTKRYAYVQVAKEGYSSANEQVYLHAERRPNRLEVALHLTSGIRGRVVDARGEPLANQRVYVGTTQRRGGTNTIERMTRSRADGTFELDGYDSAPIYLRLGATEHGPFVMREGEILDVGDLVRPETGSLIVIVEASQETIPAMTEVAATALESSTTANVRRQTSRVDRRSGVARFRSLPAGRYRLGLYVHGRTFAQAQTEVHIRPGMEQSLELALELGGHVTGVVRDPAGRPVAATQVTLISQEDHGMVSITRSIRNGTFRFRHVPPGAYRLSAGKEGAPGSTFNVHAGETHEHEIRLPLETMRLALRLVDSYGQPVNGVNVGLAYRGGGALGMQYSGSAGDVAFESVRTDLYVDAIVYTSQATTRPSPQQSGIPFPLGYLRHGEPERTLRIDGAGEHEVGALHGHVRRSPGDTPFGGATVTVERISTDGLPQVTQETRTASDGSFRFNDLPAGTYQLTVNARGHAAETSSVTVEANGNTNATITLHQEGLLLFDVRLATQAPVRLEYEAYIPGNEQQTKLQGEAQSGQLLVIHGLRQGATYRIHLRATGHESHTATYEVPSTTQSPIQVTLHPR